MSESAHIREVYEAKAHAELAASEASPTAPIAWTGDPLAEVALVKGEPEEADLSAGRALAGDDGDAAAKALAALGFDPAAVFATVSRQPRLAPAAVVGRLSLQLEAVDPRVVVALDPEAAQDVGAIFGVELRPGEAESCRGRTLLALDGFSASLPDEDLKRRVWRQLQALRRVSE